MNLYLVSCVKKSDIVTGMTLPSPPNREVYAIASNPTAAEDAAFIALHKLGISADYANNIRLLASVDQEFSDSLLAIS